MRVQSAIVAAVAAAFVSVVAAQQGTSGSYSKVGEVHIGGSGAFDYLTADPAGKRLYVTHGTEIVVIDTANNMVVGKISDTPRVHGFVVTPGGRGFSSNGGEDKVSIVDLKTLMTLNKVATGGANPDYITYEPKQKEVYAINHTGKSAAVINAASGEVVAMIPLAGVAEAAQADPDLGRVFVNIEDKSSIDVIDIATHKVVTNWPVAPASEPTGMAIDPATHRLFVGGGKALVMMDAKTGKVIADVPICTGTDATAYDPGTKMVFASCSDGNITAAKVDGDKLTVVQTIATARGARTMAVDTATHKLYVAAQDFQAPDPNAPAPATPPTGRGRGPAAVPDSFHVIVLGMK
jgi:DNA-binding beta-propeller fold protein YncE